MLANTDVATVEIPLTRGMVALVDAADEVLVAGYSWSALRSGSRNVWYAVTQVKGVWQKPGNDRWYASIKHSGRKQHLGVFDTAEDAARACDLKAAEIWGPMACLNFPTPLGATP